jgi:hypothetical protein
MEVKYHALKGFPDIDFPTGTFDLNETKHAQDRIYEYNQTYPEYITLPSQITVYEDMYHRDPKQCTATEYGEKTKPHVFEVTLESGELARIGIRFHAHDKYDMAIHIDVRNGNIVTAWINEKTRNKNDEQNLSEYQSVR